MERLFDVPRKRELCYEIAEIYRQKANEHKMFGDKILPAKCENSFFPPTMGIIFGDLFGMYYLNIGEDIERKARKYENLANSRFRICFTPSLILQKTLNSLKLSQI